jgi:hypothetical protein
MCSQLTTSKAMPVLTFQLVAQPWMHTLSSLFVCTQYAVFFLHALSNASPSPLQAVHPPTLVHLSGLLAVHVRSVAPPGCILFKA